MPDPQSDTYLVGRDRYVVDRYGTPAAAGVRPVVVILHGIDGMVGESDTEIRRLASEIAADGYQVFIPQYLETPSRTAAMPSRDVLIQRAGQVTQYRPRVAAGFAHVLAQPGVDAARVGLVGLSLGGGLALWYAETAGRGKVKALVDFFGHISDPALLTGVGALPPTLVFHNSKDTIVDPAASRALLAALASSSVPHDGTIYDKEPPYPERWEHTFKPGGTADTDSRDRTRRWLNKYVGA